MSFIELARALSGSSQHADGAGVCTALSSMAIVIASRRPAVAWRFGGLRRRADAGGDDRQFAGARLSGADAAELLRRDRDDVAGDDDSRRPDTRPCRFGRRRPARRRDPRHGRRRLRCCRPARPANSGSAGRWSFAATGRIRKPPRPRSAPASGTRATSARSMADGFFRIVDRKKDMLNRGGFKVYSVSRSRTLMGWGPRRRRRPPSSACRARSSASASRRCCMRPARPSTRTPCAATAPSSSPIAECAGTTISSWSDLPLPRNANGKVDEASAARSGQRLRQERPAGSTEPLLSRAQRGRRGAASRARSRSRRPVGTRSRSSRRSRANR